MPGENASTFVIYVRNGRYREKLVVQKPHVTLLGESRAGTVLTYADAAGTPVRAGEAIPARRTARTARATASRCASPRPTSAPSA